MKTNTVEIDKDLQDLIPHFMENRHKDVERLTAAIASHNFDAVVFLGHEIKGTCGGYGFDNLSDIGKRMELAARAKDESLCKQLIDEYNLSLKEIKIEFK